VVFESVGLFLMIILVTLSNAGGLSGAGSNIPIMLIFFGLTMNEAVPVSAFVAVSSTLFRFILNFWEKHPTRPERNTINYEIVLIVMPAVFFGSFVGVLLGNVLTEITKVVMFGTTVAWSIYTTSKKAIDSWKKRRRPQRLRTVRRVPLEPLLNLLMTMVKPTLMDTKFRSSNLFSMRRNTTSPAIKSVSLVSASSHFWSLRLSLDQRLPSRIFQTGLDTWFSSLLQYSWY
jgi:hypothetical protein